jgi:putative PIG3 family NAD(P)H quinone oxidoreductase
VRAATIRDGRIVVAEHPDPQPGPGEVLVRVRAAGLNGADQAQVLGFYPPPPDSGVPEDIPGLELAGEVAEAGPRATRFRPGDRVMAIVAGAGQAELAVVHERQLMPVPDGLGWPESGGFPEVFMTAYDAIFGQGCLRPGDRLLVHGAAGGVGCAAVQLGAVTGARVCATVRNPDSRDAVAALGAEQVIPPDGFAEHGPFDVILELVGAANLAENVSALATGGRVVMIGMGAGSRAELDLRALMVKRGRISASTLRSRPLEEKAALARQIEKHVLPFLAAGRIRVPVEATFGLDDAAAAYQRFSAGGKVGKIALIVPV